MRGDGHHADAVLTQEVGGSDAGSDPRTATIRGEAAVHRVPASDAWTPQEGHHYTVRELAKEWNLSADYIRRVFDGEPGVLVFTRRRPGRRMYRVLRIPAAVAERVYRRHQLA